MSIMNKPKQVFICPHCGTDLYVDPDEYLYKCRRCGDIHPADAKSRTMWGASK
jgi:tRNA(Ile2) C34 agmatinyltransferase TiaS